MGANEDDDDGGGDVHSIGAKDGDDDGDLVVLQMGAKEDDRPEAFALATACSVMSALSALSPK